MSDESLSDEDSQSLPQMDYNLDGVIPAQNNTESFREAVRNREFQVEGRELGAHIVQTLQGLQASSSSTQLPTRAGIRWPQAGPAQ